MDMDMDTRFNAGPVQTTSGRPEEVRASDPAAFIQDLANKTQLLACLKWLGEFQVLACIPLHGKIPAHELADLVGVPERQLCRVVRMTVTAGFLCEPQPGHISHSPLSAPFITDLSYLDATLFLAGTVAPAALQMTHATQQRRGRADSKSSSAFCVASEHATPFQAACVEQPRLQRTWNAFRRLTGDTSDAMVELLGRLNWSCLGSARIVDVGADSTSTAIALAEMYPLLHFTVQMNVPAQDSTSSTGTTPDSSASGRIVVQERPPASTQPIKDAAVYILRLSTPPVSHKAEDTLANTLLAELHAHLGVLRANKNATLILAPPLLPDPGPNATRAESMARVRDLCRLQLLDWYDLEAGELVQLLDGVRDESGRLEVVSTLQSPHCASVALAVKYQAYTNGPRLVG